MESKKKQFLTKADKILLAVVLTAAFVLLFLFRINRTPGSHAVLSCGGRAFMQISLSQQKAQYYLVLYPVSSDEAQTFSKNAAFENISVRTLSPDAWKEEAEVLLAEAGASNSTVEYNLFSCENGEIQMIQSSCPDLICVHHRPVSGTGENIVCLPHELVIEIIGGQENELDGVVY